MLVSLPRSKVEQEYLALVAAKVVDLREDIEDLVMVANEETDAALKVKLVQGTRGILEKIARLHRMSLVAAKEGPTAPRGCLTPPLPTRRWRRRSGRSWRSIARRKKPAR
jgi:hypothetical protein